ncbi:hypothetical protein BDR06DRAFT_968447 [Suillus hirtellus]|nr:hypothetical protein BDR06DRAFT_968447 [Suillus hirtellus]
MLMTWRPGCAKAKHSNNPSGYQRHPRTLELCFTERYIGPSDMVPVDVEKGKGLVEHGLRNMSSEAVTQTVLMKEADLEWNMEELKTCTAFSIVAYSQDRTSFIATDAQLDHLKFLAYTFEVSAHGQDLQAGDEGCLPVSPTNSDESAMLSDEDHSNGMFGL